MKKEYTNPEISITVFECENIITASTVTSDADTIANDELFGTIDANSLEYGN